MSKKNKPAVLVSPTDETNGAVRLSLDDAIQRGTNSREWEKSTPVTSKLYSATAIDALDISSEEPEGIGSYMLARLVALKKVSKRSLTTSARPTRASSPMTEWATGRWTWRRLLDNDAIDLWLSDTRDVPLLKSLL